MSSVCSGQITMSPSSRGPATGPVPSTGNDSTSVGSSFERCAAFRLRISSSPTNAIARWPSLTPAAARAPSAARRSVGSSPPSISISISARRILVVGLDDPLNQLVAHHVLAAEAHELDALHAAEDVADHDQARTLAAVEVDLGDVTRHDHLRVEPEPREEHLHLLRARVLSLVEDDERVVERAPAHVSQRRDLDRPALEVLVHLLRLEHVVERVEERSQVRVDLGHQVAGQEAEPLAGLDGGAGEHDAVDLAARQGGHRHRHGEERLAGARGADADGDGLVPDRVDVALLVHRLRRDLRAAVMPHDVLEDLARRLVAVERAGARLDRSGRDLVAHADQVRELVYHGLRGGHLAVAALQREDVPAQEDVAVEVTLQGLHDHVARTGQLRGHVVGKLQRGSQVSFSFTTALTRLPSARPCTFGITSDMTLPISFGELAPDSATASPTIAWSSWSESCAGM